MSAVDQQGESVLPLTAVSIDGDMNAYDVLEKATDKQNIHLIAEKNEELGMMI